jgi:hypothetical protein
MHEVLQEESQTLSFSQRYFGISTAVLVTISTVVIITGIYLGVLIFGSNSVVAYIELKEYETHLKNEVNTLKQDNARLQKEYFELKEITSHE